jgi:hypothetical protein
MIDEYEDEKLFKLVDGITLKGFIYHFAICIINYFVAHK